MGVPAGRRGPLDADYYQWSSRSQDGPGAYLSTPIITFSSSFPPPLGGQAHGL